MAHNTPSIDLDAGYVLIDRQDHPDAAVVFSDTSEALEAVDSHPLVDDLANEDSLDVRLADHGNLPSELAGREIIHP